MDSTKKMDMQRNIHKVALDDARRDMNWEEDLRWEHEERQHKQSFVRPKPIIIDKDRERKQAQDLEDEASFLSEQMMTSASHAATAQGDFSLDE
jgi:hypothetical protein